MCACVCVCVCSLRDVGALAALCGLGPAMLTTPGVAEQPAPAASVARLPRTSLSVSPIDRSVFCTAHRQPVEQGGPVEQVPGCDLPDLGALDVLSVLLAAGIVV